MFRVGRCINDRLVDFPSDDRLEVIREACRLVDQTIHCGYEIYPCNYIAYDELSAKKTLLRVTARPMWKVSTATSTPSSIKWTWPMSQPKNAISCAE